MGRRKTINREAVLDAAENVIANHGSSGLTIDAVAKAAGITKGGVQSCFGNKEMLVEAMLKRCLALYDVQRGFQEETPISVYKELLSHINITADTCDNNNSRAASLMAALLQSPEYLTSVQYWYAERFKHLSKAEGEEGTRARLAFLATEGLFFLRHFRLMQIDAQDWERYFQDIREILPEKL